jgi:uncharacterized protein (DUF1800 family)
MGRTHSIDRPACNRDIFQSLLISGVIFAALFLMAGCGATTSTSASTTASSTTTTASSQPIILTVAQPTVLTGGTDSLTATQQGTVVSGGQWSVIGGAANGTISSAGLYQAPATVLGTGNVTVEYASGVEISTASISIVAQTAPATITVEAAQSTVPTQSTDQITAVEQGAALSAGNWVVLGGGANGTISATGLYQAPQSLPTPNTVSIGYVVGQQIYETSVTVSEAAPTLQQIAPSALTTLSTEIIATGTGFTVGSTIASDSIPLATTFIDASHLSATVVLASPQSTTLQITVVSAGASANVSNALALPATFTPIQIQPATLAGGPVSIEVTGTDFAVGDVVLLSGTPLQTSVNSSTDITATGFLPPWVAGSVVVEVAGADGLQPIAAQSVPIKPTAVTFDAAARFATQAALGPRPDVVMAIQQQGFDGWITQQLAQPALTFDASYDGKIQFIHAAVAGNSLLRQRLSLALQSFLVPQDEDFYPSVTEYETLLETDASGNFRQLLTDIAGSPNIGSFLNLANNVASTNAWVQPNQNFAREVMQLFSLGPFLLNDDGSIQTDSQGNPLPTYTQDTVIDLTRALTGWTYPAPVNPVDTQWGVDWSQPLIAIEANHDSGAKLLFGTVALPAGQTAEQDRAMALDAIFNHPNIPPFISHLLIQRLVTSNPSPEYIQRISTVFENNGSGVRGDMSAIVRAVLEDPEARSGDTTPSPNDGFLKEPYLWQLSLMGVLSDPGSDYQPDSLAGTLGENVWEAPTVFGFFSPSHVIPGTTIASPEFGLMNNISVGLKSQALWNIVFQLQGGFTNNYIPNSWLFQNFTTEPAMLDALNHLLYHGTMSSQESAAISNYCSTMNPFDVQAQLQTAIFLALDAESNDVSQ